MVTEILMPQLGLEVVEATVLEVKVGLGDQVAADTPLLELETDKTITEVVAPRAGFVIAIDAGPGDVVAVGARLALIGDTADEQSGDRAPHAADGDGDQPVAAGISTHAVPDGAIATADLHPPGELRAAPVARRAAERLGITLADLVGSGPRGRITLRDVEAAAAPNSGPADGLTVAAERPEPVAAASDIEPVSRLRRTIATRMSASQLIPQYQLQRDVDATHLLAQKDAQAAARGPGRPGVNELLMQAVAEMVVRHPALGTTYVNGPPPGVRRHEDIGVGLAVATERGLLVPVLRAVHRTGLHALAEQRQRLVTAARASRLALEEMSGAAITLSNLGSFGVDRFTAMLNPGESAIVAVGRITERVVPRARGLAIVPVLTLTLSFDHRSIDGAVGGAALAELAQLLEGAMQWRP